MADDSKPEPKRRSPRPRRPDIPGLTPQRATYWVKKGFLRLEREAPDRAPGSGNRWAWPEEEIRVARDMVRLVEIGIRASAASTLARQGSGAVKAMLAAHSRTAKGKS